MATQIQYRRGNTANMSTFTGANGEMVVDTDKKVVVVHDGATAGGFPMAPINNPVFTGTVNAVTLNVTGLVSAGNGIARAAQPGEATSFNVIGRA